MRRRPLTSQPTREDVLERFLLAEVTRRGGLSERVPAFSRNGVSDRLLLLPGGGVGFVAFRQARDGRLTGSQGRRLESYARLGAQFLEQLADGTV